jgi:hypothetical protein
MNTRREAAQSVTAAKLNRLTHRIAIQLHLVAEICTICSSHSRWPVRKLSDTPPIWYLIPNGKENKITKKSKGNYVDRYEMWFLLINLENNGTVFTETEINFRFWSSKLVRSKYGPMLALNSFSADSSRTKSNKFCSVLPVPSSHN